MEKEKKKRLARCFRLQYARRIFQFSNSLLAPTQIGAPQRKLRKGEMVRKKWFYFFVQLRTSVFIRFHHESENRVRGSRDLLSLIPEIKSDTRSRDRAKLK